MSNLKRVDDQDNNDEQHILDLLSDYREGWLTPKEEARIRMHLATCASCNSAWHNLSLVLETLSSIPEVMPPRSFALTPAQAEAARARPITDAERTMFSDIVNANILPEDKPVQGKITNLARFRLVNRYAQRFAMVAAILLAIVTTTDLWLAAGASPNTSSSTISMSANAPTAAVAWNTAQTPIYNININGTPSLNATDALGSSAAGPTTTVIATTAASGAASAGSATPQIPPQTSPMYGNGGGTAVTTTAGKASPEATINRSALAQPTIPTSNQDKAFTITPPSTPLNHGLEITASTNNDPKTNGTGLTFARTNTGDLTFLRYGELGLLILFFTGLFIWVFTRRLAK